MYSTREFHAERRKKFIFTTTIFCCSSRATCVLSIFETRENRDGKRLKGGIPALFTACTVCISTNGRWVGWIEVNTEIRYSSRLFATITLTGHGVPEGKLRYRRTARSIARLAPYNSKRGRSNFTRSTWKCFYRLGPNDRDFVRPRWDDPRLLASSRVQIFKKNTTSF